MYRTKLSSKGQVVIPKRIRERHGWKSGQKLTVTETEEGILLRPDNSFKKTEIEEVAGILHYSGSGLTDEQIEQAVADAVKEKYRGRD